MVRIRHGWSVVVLGLVLALVAACKKDDPAADKSGGKSGAGNAVFGEDLALIPRDSEVVLGINVSQVQQSGLWKKFVEPALMTGDAMRRISDFKTKCGIDPMTAVKSISIGMKGAAGGKPEGVAVVHGMYKTKALACLDTMKDDMAKDGTELSHDGDVVVFKNTKGGPQVAMQYVNDTTALAVFGEQVNAASVAAAQASGQTLKSSQPFLEMFGKINPGESLWLLLSGKMLDKGAALGVKATAVFGSINVTDGLTLDLRVQFATPDDATKFAELAKSQAQQAAKMFDKADVTPEGKEVKFSIALSSQKLDALIAQAKGLLSAFGGGMGGP